MSLAHTSTAAQTLSPAPACHASDACVDADPASPAGPPALRGEVTVALDLRHAGRREVTLRYESLGAAGLPTLFVCGGISADRHVSASTRFPASGWWQSQGGQGCALDPARHRIVSFDWLGADGRLDVPLDPADQADAIAALLDVLAVPRLEAFIGCSYGAMVGLQFAALHGDRLARLVAISGFHRAHPYASAWRALQRRAVALGALQCDETHGLGLARQFAILSYRTPDEFDARFEPARVIDGRVRVGAEDYLDHCAARFVGRSSPTAYLRLSESIDLQAVDPRRIHVPVTVVAVEQDRLVPLADAQALVDQLPVAADLRVIDSPYGHDAFLKEVADIAAILGSALSSPVQTDCKETAA